MSLAAALALTARLISGANVRWLGCEPSEMQRVYFANHTSHFDFLVLWSVLPASMRAMTRPVAARDYWEAGRLRNYLATQVFNAVLIDRGRIEGQQNDAIDLMLEAMSSRFSLILFPEGTRGTESEPAPFRSGLYNLAIRRPDLEFVPVYLRNLNRVLPKGEFIPVPLISTVTFGEPLCVGDDETREGFLDRARDSVVDLSRR
jgi:1-acyl-sn-glycerol-3-phosphate acyltransferase